MQKLIGYLFFFGIKIFSLLPLPLLYFFSRGVAFLLEHVFGYRKQIVKINLNKSFPEKNQQEIKKIQRKFYLHLSDLLMESIKSFSMTQAQLKRHVRIENPELLLSYKKTNRKVIVALGHYGNWEWFALRGSVVAPRQLFALFRSLSNQTMHELVVKNRERFGLQLINERKAYTELPKIFDDSHEWVSVGFVADQSVQPKKAYWIDFLNQKTTFVKGPELTSQRFNCPILYLELKRIKRGYYVGKFEQLIDNPKDYEPGEIMELFAKRLEKQIKEEPAYWLWSHKRWKHNYLETQETQKS